MKKIYLVDVSSLFFRAFYAVRPLTSPSGLPVNAIYGFLSMVLKLMKEEKPEAMVFCYDRKEPSFRKDLFEDYKANRSEMPEDLVPQIPYIKKIADLLGIPSLEVAGYEADDLIGTLTKLAKKHAYEVDIVSGDKDFAQLVEPGVFLFDTMKSVRLGSREVKEKWGIQPHQMIDYLALVGDSSDNIPGVKGIGPKGAQKLLEQYQDLDGIYEHLAEIKGSTHEKLVTHKEMAYLSKKLVTIVTDVVVDQAIANYHLRPAAQASMQEFLQELNFRGFEKALNDLPNWSESQKTTKPVVLSDKEDHTTQKVESHDDVNQTKTIRSEQSSLIQEIEIIQISLEQLQKDINPNQEAYLFRHAQGLHMALSVEGPLYQIMADTSELSKDFDKLRIHCKGFDLKNLWHDLNLQNPKAIWDCKVASYVLRAGESMDWAQVFSRSLGRLPLELPSPAEYLQELNELEQQQRKELQIQAANEKIFFQQDLPLIPILFRMEQKGILLETSLLQDLSQQLGREIRDLEKAIHDLAKEEFNIGSPKQLSQILFEKLKLTPGKKTKTGFSTDAEVLEGLKHEHPIVEQILIYRELTKLKSTYVDALPQMVKADGRIHTTFDQTQTTTGRLSSLDPNLQNIPIRTPRGSQVRKAFVAASGMQLLSADYSQIELRILAHYADDANLIKAFQDDLDIHAATASEVFSVKLSEVTADQRRAAKAINFGIAYGQGAFGLSAQLGVSMTEAKEIIQNYFSKFPGVQTYISQTIEEAKQKGFVETLTGRRRYMHELKSSNPAIRKFGERAAINAPIQGTAADLMKLAMIELDKKIRSTMILQVHDELIFEAPRPQLETEQGLIVGIMQNIMKLKVPLKANSSLGQNWDEAHG